jgi:hypothetical protein
MSCPALCCLIAGYCPLSPGVCHPFLRHSNTGLAYGVRTLFSALQPLDRGATMPRLRKYPSALSAAMQKLTGQSV